MAENESLDLADSRRWQSAYHAVRQGKSSREVASRVVRGIYGNNLTNSVASARRVFFVGRR